MVKNQTVLITGSSSGLGQAIAYRLAREKAVIILLARNETRLIQVKQEIIKAECRTEYFVCDITDNGQIEKTVKKILEKFGRIDILVNNAGIWHEGKLGDHTPEKIQELFATNTLGTINMTRAILPVMKARNSGQILNVISVAGVEYAANWGVYTATKQAVRGFTESLILELTDTKIKVMAIYPGGMDTEIFVRSGSSEKRGEPWMMHPEDVAEVVHFMLTRPSDILLNHVEVRKIIR